MEALACITSLALYSTLTKKPKYLWSSRTYFLTWHWRVLTEWEEQSIIFEKKGLNIVSLNLANMISDQVSSSFRSVVSLIICTFSYARITLRRTMIQKKWCATIVLSEIWIFCPRARHSFLWTLRSIREIEDAVESKGFPPFFCANLVSDTIDTNDIGLHSM